ncbi:outer membrane beta-barrel protein [Sphingosinicella soli]|uniref:Outer membrane immunogenic protein n=1 Tax=Sphingosinicella soli TaxID=333708 RepID=A0A7W7F6I0_9SPHN|nr:outer membrane beta-barrel protein [Sphingosinicella soli]MBB4632540.1 outer membrane immunogenic protein [Sphingosinicella soli]
MKKLVLASLAALAVVSPASAEMFNGGYAGLGATLDNVNGSGPLEGLGASGAGLTGFVGYDLPLGAAFVGLEGNIDLNTADAAGIEAKWGWGASARVGFKINDATGLYGRVGYQRNKISGGGISAWGDGVRFGGGVETAISGNAALRAEFNHVNFEDDVINNQGVVGVLFRF